MLKYVLQQVFERSHAPPTLAPDPESMSRFLSHCEIQRVAAKTAVLSPGDPADTLYYVIDGSLAVCSEDEHGNELILAYISRGQFIGEMGLFIEQDGRESIVRARSRCELARIRYDRLFELFEGELKEERCKLLYAVGYQLSQRLLRTSRQVSRIAYMDVYNRVVKTLLDLCEEPDAMSHPEGTQLRISRQELSRIVGCSREMVGRMLRRLQDQELITAAGKTIVVRGTR